MRREAAHYWNAVTEQRQRCAWLPWITVLTLMSALHLVNRTARFDALLAPGEIRAGWGLRSQRWVLVGQAYVEFC